MKALRPWIAGVGLACLAIVAAYVPPRGRAPERPSRLTVTQPLPAKRLRANAMAWEWRAADRAVRLAEYREALRLRIADLRRTDAPGPALLFDGPLTDSDRAVVTAQLDTVWRALHLGAPKVAVGVVVATPAPDTPVAGRRIPTRQESSSPALLLPDSTDRATCVTLVPLDRWSRQRMGGVRLAGGPRLDAWLRQGLGVCAFYAALGAPGEPIGRWLRARRLDLGILAEWDRPPGQRRKGWFGPEAVRHPWFWHVLYAMPADAVACLGGRASGCRGAVLAGADGTAPASRTLDTERWWQRQLLFGGEWYLSDLVRAFGRDRVARFWNSDLPVDSAFAQATGMDIGRWTRRWQGEQLARLPLGPRPPFAAAALGLVLAGAAVAATAGLARRRRVS